MKNERDSLKVRYEGGIEGYLWDQTFENFPNIFEKIFFYLELNDLQRHMQMYFEYVKEAMAHKEHVERVVLKVVNYLSNEVFH